MGIGVTGSFFPLGNFPIIEDTYILGGYRAFLDIADRNAIPPLDRKVGMLVRTDNTGQVWRLSGGILDANWVLDTSPPSPPPATVTDLYVSGLNGSDANDGLTPGTAVATLAAAFALVPITLGAPLVIHLGRAGAPGTPYAWAPFPTPTQLTQNARVWLYGDGAGQAGEDGFDVTATLTVAAGTTAEQIKPTVPIVADAYAGQTLEIVNGPAANYRRTVLFNDTTDIVPVRRFETEDATAPVTPAAGNTIRILRPSVIFDGYDTAGNADGIPGLFSGIGAGDGGAPLLLVNLAFDSVPNQTEINRCSVFCAGVEFRGTVAPIFTNCNGSFGNWDNIFETAATQAALPNDANLSLAKTGWFADIAFAPSSPLALWRGWGVSQPDIVAVTAATTGLRFLSCQMSAFAVVGDIHSNESTLALGGRFRGDVTIARGFCHLLGRSVSGFLQSIFDRKIRTELATVLAQDTGAFAYLYAAAAEAQWESINSDVELLNGGVFNSVVSTFLDMSGGGWFEIQGAWTLDFTLDYLVTPLGLIHVSGGTFTQGATFVSQNNVTGVVKPAPAFLVEGLGRAVAGAPTTVGNDAGALVAGYGIIVQNGGSMQNNDSMTLNAAYLRANAGNYAAAADLTIVSASNDGGIELVNGATFLQTAGDLSSTGNAGLEATDSTFMLDGTTGSVTLIGTFGRAFELVSSMGTIKGTTTFTGGFALSRDSELLLSQNDAITAGELVVHDSKLFTDMLDDLIFTGPVTLQEAEIVHAQNGTNSVSYNTAGAGTTLIDSTIQGRIEVTIRNLTAQRNSVISVGTGGGGGGDLNLVGPAVLEGSSIICGEAGAAGSVSLVADDTFDATSSDITVDGQFNVTGAVDLNRCNCDMQSVVCASMLTLLSTEFTCTTLGATILDLTDSELSTNGAVSVEMLDIKQGHWFGFGDMTGSTIAPTATAGLVIAESGLVNLQGVSAGQLHIVGVAGQNSVRVLNNGEFSFNNANILIDTGDFGIEMQDGARIYTQGAPTNVTGTSDDFTDDQGAFSNGIVGATLATGRCIFTGQHAGGVYVLAPPTSASFVQRM